MLHIKAITTLTQFCKLFWCFWWKSTCLASSSNLKSITSYNSCRLLGWYFFVLLKTSMYWFPENFMLISDRTIVLLTFGIWLNSDWIISEWFSANQRINRLGYYKYFEVITLGKVDVYNIFNRPSPNHNWNDFVLCIKNTEHFNTVFKDHFHHRRNWFLSKLQSTHHMSILPSHKDIQKRWSDWQSHTL